ncbi:MAG: LOG family protein [Candidatus Aminicenantes bacterium]|nr:LOG family protein [Candidatus Aminicenantes bacterium]
MKRAEKAYKNLEFLRSREARTLRILSEYLEPEKRFEEKNIQHTVVFYGSSRVKPEAHPKDKLDTHKYYWAAEELAFQLANFSKELEKDGPGFNICSGGGPGIMEAANRGAGRAGADSIGLNISIPHEQLPNDYITPELNFEFHYFFMRKLWFLYHAKALVVFPGGFGTMDELFETLTLIQTEKLEKTDMPILLYDPTFWREIINFDKLVEYGVISPEDLDLFKFFSTPEEGLELLKSRLKEEIANFKI